MGLTPGVRGIRDLGSCLKRLILQAVLEQANRAIVGHAPGFASGFDAGVLGASALIEDLEHLRFPTCVVGFRYNPELPGADANFTRHRFNLYFGRTGAQPYACEFAFAGSGWYRSPTSFVRIP